MARPRIALALGSGSARGWAHVGVIEALCEAGFAPDIICGTSMGALVGAAHAAGRLEALRRWAGGAGWREIVGLLDVRLAGGGLIEGGSIVAFLRGLGIDGRIEDLSLPYAAVATDLASGREEWLQSGPVLDAVRASIALPGIISPARLGDRWLIDGGLTNPVPVSLCRALGADRIIAVNLNGDLLGRRFAAAPAGPGPAADLLGRLLHNVPKPLRDQSVAIALRLLPQGPSAPGYFDVLANAVNIMQDRITRARLAGEPPHVMLAPRLRDLGLMEFNRAAEAIAEGRACVAEALPAIRRLV
ncbi:patatin-like phospholipase family protein [Stella sp.]|uniref:patatin-like phospholipase family protein n=1 Tax=Stella sp. TaxID=2912054 RepID=UPI0035B41295